MKEEAENQARMEKLRLDKERIVREKAAEMDKK